MSKEIKLALFSIIAFLEKDEFSQSSGKTVFVGNKQVLGICKRLDDIKVQMKKISVMYQMV